LVQKFSRSKVHNALCLPILVYGSEFWTFGGGIKTIHITRDEIFQNTIFDHKLNEVIVDRVDSTADEKLKRYKSNWLRHVTIMNNNGMRKTMLNYRPNWRKWRGRHL